MKMADARLRRHEWTVEPVELARCREMVARLHYAGSGANTGTAMHGLFRRDDPLTCHGIAWWMPPTKGAAVNTWPYGDWRKVLALTRLVIEPETPSNAASFLLAGSVRRLRAEHRWECLVTYADTWQGHTGAIYRAANWEYVGMTAPQPTWVDQDGRMVARLSTKSRTRADMEALGHRMIGSHAKHKYRLPLVKEPVRLSA